MTAIVDARSLSVEEPLQSAVCIVGGGAAGLTLATQLGELGFEVLLLEAGGERIDAATQALYVSEQQGQPYFDLAASRLRFLGGTTNHWAGYCRGNDPIDYLGRPELGVPAWPIRHEQLQPYVDRAAMQLGLDPRGFDVRRQLARHGSDAHRQIDLASRLIESQVVLIARRKRMQETHVPALIKHPRVRLLTYANVTHVQLEPGARSVTELRVQTLTGRRLRVRARHYVLAAHALENARLLLCSNDVMHTGIGNESDHVGRYFQEHPSLSSGLWLPSKRFPMIYSADHARKGAKFDLKLSATALRELGVLQYHCGFRPVGAPSQVETAVDTLSAGFWKPADLHALRALETLLADVPSSLRYVANRGGITSAQHPVAYQLEHRIEQTPNADSRLTLSLERDVLDMQRLHFHWALSSLDERSFAVGQSVLVAELTRLGMGRFEGSDLDPATMRRGVAGRFHNMGTTRMSASAIDGVVDSNCRVHGVDNLYVAGSSVFATSGNSTPTLMLIALALRLADHLGERLKST